VGTEQLAMHAAIGRGAVREVDAGGLPARTGDGAKQANERPPPPANSWPAAITAAQAALVEIAGRTRIYLDHVDGWLLDRPTLLNRRERSG